MKGLISKNWARTLGLGLILLSTACQPFELTPIPEPVVEEVPAPPTPDSPMPTALPARPPFEPGTLVEYIAQTGDTLPALAAHFNTTEAEIRMANPIIPGDATTMPASFPMQIPIYYRPLWGTPYQIVPDSLFVNGPAQRDFDAVAYVNDQPGWLKDYRVSLATENLRGGEIINHVAVNFSLSPRLLLAMLEYQLGALTNPERPESLERYSLGYRNTQYVGLLRQLTWAANTLNNSYYGWRNGSLDTFNHLDGRTERPDPWQNAATVALQYYYSKLFPDDAYNYAVSGNGLAQTYLNLFGDPWSNVVAHIEGSLRQPELSLPFAAGRTWAYTGGPHTGWGDGEPFSALDFAPPSVVGGCSTAEDPATAIAAGIVVRTGDALAMLDLDGDGDERTGWVILYLHLANDSLPAVGAVMLKGDPIGMPSCEGGRATGSHVHIARKYNGEWILAEGPLAFNLEGWVAKNGEAAYDGTLTKLGHSIRACVCSDRNSQIQASQQQ
ncbi:MAG: hypothetical protein ACYDHA_10405 [Bellilinea sp.]